MKTGLKQVFQVVVVPVLGILLYAAGCAGVWTQDLLHGSNESGKAFVIWAHSDVQPRDGKEFAPYAEAVRDVHENLEPVSVAIFAGDLVQDKESEAVYDWAYRLRRQVEIPAWLEIAGNHEWKNIELYRKKAKKPLRYTAAFGNIFVILMSNEKEGKRTFLSDDTFQWWRKHVIENQDKIIITVTHGCLKHSGLAASRFEKLRIVDSERFVEVLKQYRVDIWISGHSHLPRWFPRMKHRNNRLNGTTFIDLGAIRKDFLTGVESRFLYFMEGTDRVSLRYRNHGKKKFTGQDTIRLSHRFTFRGEGEACR